MRWRTVKDADPIESERNLFQLTLSPAVAYVFMCVSTRVCGRMQGKMSA